MRVSTPVTFFAVSRTGKSSNPRLSMTRNTALGSNANVKYLKDLDKVATTLEWRETLIDERLSEEGAGTIRNSMIKRGVRRARSTPGNGTTGGGAGSAGLGCRERGEWVSGRSGYVPPLETRRRDGERPQVPPPARRRNSRASSADPDTGRRGDQRGRRIRGGGGGEAGGRGEGGNLETPHTADGTRSRSGRTKVLSPASHSHKIWSLLDHDDDAGTQQEGTTPATPGRHRKEQAGARGQVGGRGGRRGILLPPIRFPVTLHSPCLSEPPVRNRNRSVFPSPKAPVKPSQTLEEENDEGGVDEMAVGVLVAVAAAVRKNSVGEVKGPPLEEVPLLDGEVPSLPPVWVTQYLDYWSAYGMVFVLSNGSVGLLFKDDTKMVLGPSGTTFDYSDPSSGWDQEAEEQSLADGSAPKNPQASTPKSERYTADYFPLYLRKKFDICRYFRDHLLPDGGGGGAGSGVEEPPVDEQLPPKPLVFLERWRSDGETNCFELSDQTMQVGGRERERAIMKAERKKIQRESVHVHGVNIVGVTDYKNLL